MAALLHDVGHLPLSHSLEGVYRDQIKKAAASRETEIERDSKESPKGRKPGNAKSSTSLISPSLHPPLTDLVQTHTPHEALSAYLATSSELTDVLENRNNKYRYDPEEIATLILGSHTNTFFDQLMHSDMDVDTMDYLRRDARATGINYGEFSLPYLLGNLETKKTSKGGKRLLCVNEKALHTVEHFILAKYFYYLQILYHKKRRIYDFLAHMCAKWLMKAARIPSLTELESWIQTGQWHTFDDYFFVEEVRRYSQRRDITDLKKGICNILLRREKVEMKFNKSFRLEKKKDRDDNDDQRDINRIIAQALETVSRRKIPESNLLEEQSVLDAAPKEDGLEHFPLVIEERSVYDTKERTQEKTKDEGIPSEEPVGERDAIKVLRRGSLVNVNSIDESIILPLSRFKTVLVRYYYFPKDKLKSLLS